MCLPFSWYILSVSKGKLNSEGLEFDVSPPIPICGDVKVELFQKGMFKKVGIK